VPHDGDRHRGGQDEPDRRQRDDPRVLPQGAQVDEEGRGVQQRRQEDEQDEVGVELDMGDSRHQAQDEAAEDQRDRVGDLEPVGDRVEAGGRDEERRDDDLQIPHPRDSSA
jgi:hypothetical protein